MTKPERWVSISDLPETWEHEGNFGAGDDPGQHGHYSLTFHRDDTTISISEQSARWDPPRSLSGLGTVNFRALAEACVVDRLFGLAIDRMRAELGPAGMYEHIDDARDDARLALGLTRTPKSRIDKAFLKEVVGVYKSDPRGVDAVIERYEVTERTARRWLARAKKEGVR